MTLKEELDQAKASLQAAETARDNFKTQLETEQKAHAETKQKLSAAEQTAGTEQKAHGETKQKLSAAEQERDTLKAKDTTAAGKAAESLAKNGIAPAAKDEPGNLAPSAGDPVALWQAYSAASPTEQATMRAKHGDKLDEAAAAYDRAQASAK